MKIIKYNLCTKVKNGTEEVLFPVEMPWSEDGEKIAKAEAHNGKYTVEDDGQPGPTDEPSSDEILNTLLGV